MPLKIFGNSSSSNNNDYRSDTSLFVQKLHLGSNYIEAKIEEDIDLKINTEIKIYRIPLTYEKQLQKTMLIVYSTSPVKKNNFTYRFE